ncbi:MULTISPECIES: hypothetical protein [unclassified Halanaerobium]|uniref:hypothetical protein n=1 Tax=unclassified Halanaerobium TaxID=2641197 RepID=UPI000DF12E75|nr:MULTISPECIES: hypothetical protein [unclassified Halanaerobium]RCW40922.1 hypothetical protein DFR78_14015 [Halanaerobium sp. MA284_MarDTE_T2]RCW79234.1 hypothetical protein DER71_14115 [Halanaerobium sp. DL-01]
MNFVRSGPQYLFLKADCSHELSEKLVERFNAEIMSFPAAVEIAQEDSVIAFIVAAEKNTKKVKNADEILYISCSPLKLMAELINNTEIAKHIESLETGPGQLVMRIPKNGEKIIKKIKESYGAEETSILEGIDNGDSDSTIISFTDQAIRSKIMSMAYVLNNILVNKTPASVFNELRRDAVQYITQGIDNTEWYELKINIYDSDELYDLEYERLLTILSDLEVGIILGESWTKDHAFALFSITAYQLRLFTFLSPLEIKKILIGFEYNEAGERLVDYDLFHKSDKINWSQLAEGKGKVDRKAVAKKFRQEVLEQLTDTAKKRYYDLEKEITEKSK